MLSCDTLYSFPIGQASVVVVQRGRRGAEGGLGGWVAGGLEEGVESREFGGGGKGWRTENTRTEVV